MGFPRDPFYSLFAPAQDARRRLMHPRIDLEIALLLRGQPQLDAAVGADQRLLREAAAILDRQLEQPLVRQPAAYFTSIFRHRVAACRELRQVSSYRICAALHCCVNPRLAMQTCWRDDSSALSDTTLMLLAGASLSAVSRNPNSAPTLWIKR